MAKKERSWMIMAVKLDNSRSRRFIVDGVSIFDASFKASAHLRNVVQEFEPSAWSVDVTDLDAWCLANPR